jgi:hypothetical protein
MASWYSWLYETVTWNEQETMPRWRAIQTFVRRGLIPLVKRGGYDLHGSEQDLMNRIATGLFNNRLLSYTESDWRFGIQNNDMTDEDRDHFNFVLDSDVWANFWSAWGCWDDVHETSWRGQDRRLDIQDYIWTQVDVENSQATEFINEIFGISDDDDSVPRAQRRAQDDTYLRETVDAGYDGYRR